MRLSNNWLVSKLMAIYVEIFRNIPVLIWIIIIFTIMTAALPGPRDLPGRRRDEPRSMLFDLFAFTNRGFTYSSARVLGSTGILVVGIAAVQLAYRDRRIGRFLVRYTRNRSQSDQKAGRDG